MSNFYYIICFWDKSKIQVSEETGENLKEAIQAGEVKFFELNNSLYSIAGIEKIISKHEAYESFPTEYEYLKNLETRESYKEFMENPQHKIDMAKMRLQNTSKLLN